VTPFDPCGSNDPAQQGYCSCDPNKDLPQGVPGTSASDIFGDKEVFPSGHDRDRELDKQGSYAFDDRVQAYKSVQFGKPDNDGTTVGMAKVGDYKDNGQ
jgi:hypothetical protein